MTGTSECAISVRALTKRFGDFTAVKDVSFDVERGEIFGYLGANGAGKSTTIRILCGLLTATSGVAEVADVDVVHHPDAVRRVIGYMSQRFSLYLDLTVQENLAFFGGAYGLFGREFIVRRDAVISSLGLAEMGDAITSSLPGGARQRLALACALLHRPRIVFLDEPTAGVDPEARRAFWRLIRDLANDGTTIFVTTHYMDEAEYCDRVGLMAQGSLAALGTPAALKRDKVPGRMYEVNGADVALVRSLEDRLPIRGVEPFGAALHVHIADESSKKEDLQRALAERGAPRAHVDEVPVTLEEVFLRVVGDETKSASP
jgi:ABC-2 type transport system ATP-binding protein